MDDATGAIYVPPKNGLPFLVVTFSNGAIHTQTAESRSEARVMLAKQDPAPGSAGGTARTRDRGCQAVATSLAAVTVGGSWRRVRRLPRQWNRVNITGTNPAACG